MFSREDWHVDEINSYEAYRVRDPFLDDEYHGNELDVVTRPWERANFLVDSVLKFPEDEKLEILADSKNHGCVRILLELETLVVEKLKRQMIQYYFERTMN